MELKELFPDISSGPAPMPDDTWISVEDKGLFYHFPKNDLTERERLLLEMISEKRDSVSRSHSPWEHYLLDGKGHMPDQLETYQFLYINHQDILSEELIDLLKTILTSVQTLVRISQTRTAFLLLPQDGLDDFQLVKDILPTVESDFGIALSAFMGNQWTLGRTEQLRPFFEEENTLFSAYLSQKGDRKLISFSELMLWSLLVNIKLTSIQEHFNQIFLQNKEVSDMVTALWQCQGNLVQTAHKLFIHRNSLQYKLDKLSAQSGLNLKNLDDLAFAHLFLLN